MAHYIGEIVYYAEDNGICMDIKSGVVKNVLFNKHIGEDELAIVWGGHETGIRNSSVLSPCDYALIHHIQGMRH